MSDIYPVTRERHGSKAWRKHVLPDTAVTDQVVSLVSRELVATQQWTVCAFMKLPGSDGGTEFIPVAMLGFQKNQNLFVGADGRWSGRTLPAIYATHPFKLGMVSREGKEELALCVDEAGGLVVEAGQGEPFFDPDGQPSAAAKNMLRELLRYRQDREQTRSHCRQLEEAGLFQAWPLRIEDSSGVRVQDGLFRIDESVLKALAPETLAALRDSGALALAYGQLFSMQNANLLGTLAAQRTAPVVPPAPGGDFTSQDHGIISFDNL